jgi:hypothetical protein
MVKSKLIFAALIAGVLVGCGPAQVEIVKEIRPNETAFLVPLEGNTKTDQKRFMSEEFLSQSKLAAKRVVIPQRTKSTGRFWWQYEWIPTVLLITVDRQPISREWTQSDKNATAKTQTIKVESTDGIGFGVGVTITAEIPEEYAAKYQYNFGGKPLSIVAEENIRPIVQSALSREFGTRRLEDSRSEKKEIFSIASKEVVEFFDKKGIKITNIGYSDGMAFDDPHIQAAINDNFKREMSVESARQEGLAQEKRNAMKIATAVAERQAAEEFAKAREASSTKYALETERAKIEKWDGKFPTYYVNSGGGGGMMIQLPAPSAAAGK